MNLPQLLKPDLIDAALLGATEDAQGRMLVPAYDVPDHYTVTRGFGMYDGLAALNRIGLAYRAELLTRIT